MTSYCPDCLVTEVSPTARDGRCIRCRPSRSHSQPREPQPKADRISRQLAGSKSGRR